MRTIIAAAIAVLISVSALSIASANPAPTSERCRVADGQGAGRWAKCGSPGSVSETAYKRQCERKGTPCKVKRPKSPKSQAPAHVRTTRCDGLGDLKTPTTRPCSGRAIRS